jgi:hypothetical protein
MGKILSPASNKPKKRHAWGRAYRYRGKHPYPQKGRELPGFAFPNNAQTALAMVRIGAQIVTRDVLGG